MSPPINIHKVLDVKSGNQVLTALMTEDYSYMSCLSHLNQVKGFENKFREPVTSESISILSYLCSNNDAWHLENIPRFLEAEEHFFRDNNQIYFERHLYSIRDVFHSRSSIESKTGLVGLNPKTMWLGRITLSSEGVFVNPPKYPIENKIDGNPTEISGKPISNEFTLRKFLNKAKKIRKIWLYEEKDAPNFGFAPYDSFEQGVIPCEKFCEGGLARVLEHTYDKKAVQLSRVFSDNFYTGGISCFFRNIKNGVAIIGFYSTFVDDGTPTSCWSALAKKRIYYFDNPPKINSPKLLVVDYHSEICKTKGSLFGILNSST